MAYVKSVIAIAATVWLLIVARDVIQPVMLALFLWFLTNSVARFYTRLISPGATAPTMPARLAGIVTFAILFVLMSGLIANNVDQLRDNLPTYEANFDRMIASLTGKLGLTESFRVGDLVARIDVSQAAVSVAGSAAGFVSSLIIIIFYVVFISAEFRVAGKKLASILPDETERARAADVAARIMAEIETYFGVKLVLGIVQAIPTFAVLKLLGVDSPGFWAVLIFFFSFVPTVGTLIGIVFPSLITLVQFEEIRPFLIVVSTLATVQILASNWLEPRLMGRSLNLSPLAIFIGIFAGGALWGITGALIVVPLLAVALIVFTQIPSLRWVAVLLSSDGCLAEAPTGDGAPPPGT